VVVTVPLAEESALDPGEFNRALEQAEADACRQGVCGPALTPFLLGRLAHHTEGRTLRANRELIVANARLAGQIACAGECASQRGR
jgi:pseudouridine-5'-phosphate glycosidase